MNEKHRGEKSTGQTLGYVETTSRNVSESRHRQNLEG